MKQDNDIMLYGDVYTPERKSGGLFLIDNHVCFVDDEETMEEPINDGYYSMDDWFSISSLMGNLIMDGWIINRFA